MNILQIAEQVYPNQLSKIQKDVLIRYEYARNNSAMLNASLPPRNGRTMIAKVIEKWEEQNEQSNINGPTNKRS